MDRRFLPMKQVATNGAKPLKSLAAGQQFASSAELSLDRPRGPTGWVKLPTPSALVEQGA